MRKTIPVLFLFTCILLSLAGCRGSQAEAYPESMDASSDEIVLSKSEERSQEDPSVSEQQDEPIDASEVSAPGSAVSSPEAPAGETEPPAASIAAEHPQNVDTSVPSEPAQPSYTQAERPAESKPASSEPAAPTQSEQPAEPSAPAQTQVSEPEKPDFDIGYWVSYAQDYAGKVGLVLNPEAIYCWDTPITAGSHCLYLERDIQNRLDRYSRDSDITAVWIWAESCGDGSYDLYLGYA